MNARLFLFLLIFSYSALLGQQAQKTDTAASVKPIAKDTAADKIQTISLTEYGINGHIDIPVIDGYEPIISNIGKKKEKKVHIVVSSAFRLDIVAEATTFSDAEIYLAMMKKAETEFWFKQNPADPLPTMIINESNAYLMHRGREYKLAYIVTIDKIRYTITCASGVVYNLEDALRYVRLAKTFFPK